MDGCNQCPYVCQIHRISKQHTERPAVLGWLTLMCYYDYNNNINNIFGVVSGYARCSQASKVRALNQVSAECCIREY